MGDEDRIDTTCAWLAECWDYGVDEDNERLCPSYDEEGDREDWERMCRLAPIDVVYSICDFESCAQAADAWSGYPVSFDSLCGNEGFESPSDASEPAARRPDPEPDCDGESERLRCAQGCEWGVQCAERPQCSGDSTPLRMTCMTACETLSAPLTTLLCGSTGCDEAIGVLQDALVVTVPVCSED